MHVTASGYRAINGTGDLLPGEICVTAIPAGLIQCIRELEVRADRDQTLRATDWTQMADAPLTALEKAAYQTYRQALRDLPSAPGFPDVPWPPVPMIKDGAASNGQGTIHP